jgi:hypothetical protein
MRDSNRQDTRSETIETATPSRIDPAEMWENLCRADELLDECEFLAAARATRSPEFATPSNSVSPTSGEGTRVPVLGLADLLRLKLEAGGPKDLWDAARLLRRYPEELPRALAQASSLGVEDELRRWLER